MPDPWETGKNVITEISPIPGTGFVLDFVGKLKGDQTVNYGPKEQAALDSVQGQKIYKGYRDYGLPKDGAAALTVADLVTGDKYADQKAWRKLMFSSPLYQAQVKYPNNPEKWPPAAIYDEGATTKPDQKNLWEETKGRAEELAKSKVQGFLDSLLGPLTDRGGSAAGKSAATRLLPWIVGGVAVLGVGIYFLARRK